MSIWLIVLLLIGVLLMAAFYSLFISNVGLHYKTTIEGKEETLTVRINSWLSKLLPSFGIVIDEIIHLDATTANAMGYMLAHEWKHVLQQREIGSYKFLFKYLTSKKFKKEKEAEAHQYGEDHQYDPAFQNFKDFLKNNTKKR